MNTAKVSQYPVTSLLWPALVGATLSIPVELVGTLYVGEILLLAAFIHAALRNPAAIRQWPHFMGPLTLSLLLLIAGYLLSDLLVHTEPRDMLRGGARVIFVLVDVCGLAAVAGYSSARMQALALGFSVGAVAVALTASGEQSFLASWKFNLGYPISIGVALILGNIGRLKTLVAPLAFLGLGILHVYLDSRSLGTLCIVVSAIILANVVRSSRWRLLALPATGVALVLAALLVASSLSDSDEFASRRRTSDSWRLAAMEVTMGEIFSSPLIGHGSWASNAGLLDAVEGKQRDNGSERPVTLAGGFQSHSMLLQAWFEGGLLALIFPVLYGVAILRGIRAVWRSARHFKSPQLLLLLLLFTGLAHLLFSPFNGSHRIDIAFAVSACIVAIGWRDAARARGRRLGTSGIRRRAAMAGPADPECSLS